MSRQHINQYRRTLAEQHAATGSLNEGVVSKAFAELLERTGRARELIFTPQWEGRGPRGNLIKVDGALVPKVLRIPFGYWEAKDEKDDLDREIAAKRANGYPDDNIIYEDTRIAVLRQDGVEVARVDMRADDDGLNALIERFYAYERPELSEFRAAAAKFRTDLPQVLDALNEAIAEAQARSSEFARARADFLAHAKQAINPSVSDDDVASMLIQHILTEEIFASVFDNAQYHRENNVAQRLGELEAKFFTGALRHATTERLRPYYGAIKAAAAQLADRREKQTFLKGLYEDFYKVYDPNAADRLGVVYTPGEIVRFMVRGAEWLTDRHFGKLLSDEGVEILDPATGTGTFVVELLEHMRGAGPARLAAKYANELHANEVAILPYYVANLNIEATYAAIGNGYAEFPGLVFVDTLDNTAGLGIFKGHQPDLLGGTSDENLERVKRQNAANISVIIGNPPYNAWQSDYNARNPNRPYRRVDERIGQTYRRLSRAQNTNSLSDMYVRFWRWASDRLRGDGVIAFVTNRNFVEKVAFDGFRLSVAQEFAECWIMNLGGDVRANPKISGTKHNVFGIQTGVCIAFMIRDAQAKGFKLRYARRPEDETAKDKLAFLDGVQDFDRWDTARLKPDAKGNWLSGEHDEWASYLPLADPSKGLGDDVSDDLELARLGGVAAVFRLSSNGVKTQRDEWVWADDRSTLKAKTKLLIVGYDKDRKSFADLRAREKKFDNGDQSNAAKAAREDVRKWKPESKIKWDESLEQAVRALKPIRYTTKHEIEAQFRPFTKAWLYFDEHLNGRTYRLSSLFRRLEKNPTIAFLGVASQSELAVQATNQVFDLGYLKAGNGGTAAVTRYRYTSLGERVDNITVWALQRFKARYPGEAVTKDRIFAYTYAALHDPVFREVHAADLRREFPRVPLHDDFARWADWGERLLALHIDYEGVEGFGFGRVDTAPATNKAERAEPVEAPSSPSSGASAGRKKNDPSTSSGWSGGEGRTPKPKLKSIPQTGTVVVDSVTQLTGIPARAWEYRLGNRSAIDWVLDQHKEKTIKDPVVRAKFDTYRFADHKEAMIALMAKVVTVSFETVAITDAMRAARELQN